MLQGTASEKNLTKDFKKYDVGDVIGIKGEVFTDKNRRDFHPCIRGYTSFQESSDILPEKFHGLTNTDMRYRQRYVDLIMNPGCKRDISSNVPRVISSDPSVIWTARDSWKWRLRCLLQNAGGAAARPFETHFNALDEDLKLRISLELYLKTTDRRRSWSVSMRSDVYSVTKDLIPDTIRNLR